MPYYKITYEIPNVGIRIERYSCFYKLQKRFAELTEKYAQVTWEKVIGKKEK